VFSVTAGAGGAVGNASLQSASVNGLLVFFLDLRMTFTAGVLDVEDVNRRSGIASALEGVVSVAVEAGGCEIQASVHGLTMYGSGIGPGCAR